MSLINDSKINLGHSPALQCLDRSHLNGFRPIGHSVVRLDYADVRQAKVVKGLNRLIYQRNSIDDEHRPLVPLAHKLNDGACRTGLTPDGWDLEHGLALTRDRESKPLNSSH